MVVDICSYDRRDQNISPKRARSTYAGPLQVEKVREIKKGKEKVKKNSTLMSMFLEMITISSPMDIILGSASLPEKEEIKEEERKELIIVGIEQEKWNKNMLKPNAGNMENPQGGDIVGKPRHTAAKAKAKVRRTGTSISLSKIVQKISSRSRSALSGSAAVLLTMLKLLALNVLLQDHPKRPKRVPHPYHLIMKDHFHISGKQNTACLTILLADG